MTHWGKAQSLYEPAINGRFIKSNMSFEIFFQYENLVEVDRTTNVLLNQISNLLPSCCKGNSTKPPADTVSTPLS